MQIKNDKEIIHYEQIVSGALTKLEQVDDFDLYLIINDLKKNGELNFFTPATIHLDKIKHYVDIFRLDDTKVKLKDGISLKSKRPDGISVRDYFIQIAGQEMANYFSNFDINSHKKRKEEVLRESRIKILNDSNVLFISNDDEEIEAFKKYGYKNVNYFKSIIRADNYFRKNPKELYNYDLVIIGSQDIDYKSGSDIGLLRTLNEQRNKKIIELEEFTNWKHYNSDEYSLYLTNFLRGFINSVRFQLVTEVYDKITDQMLLNNLIKPISKKKYVPIDDYVKSKKLPFPINKKDLKILFCEAYGDSEVAFNIARSLEIKIDHFRDHNFRKQEICKLLGEYDIIIVSENFSGSLVRATKETTEQCKDTGRRLALLVSYDTEIMSYLDNRAKSVSIKYYFGGELSSKLESGEKAFYVCASTAQEELLQDSNFKRSMCSRAILEESVNIYNNVLKQISGQTIRDLDFKTAEEYQTEYDDEVVKERKRLKEEQERLENELAPIKLYYAARRELIDYLSYEKSGVVDHSNEVSGINILEENPGGAYGNITVENMYGDKALCALTFDKHLSTMVFKGDIAILNVQIANSKGNMGKKESVGIYTSNYEGSERVPKYPSSDQLRSIQATCKKIINILGPLNRNYEKLKQENKQKYKNNKKKT